MTTASNAQPSQTYKNPPLGLVRVKVVVEYEADVWVDDAYLPTDAKAVVDKAMRSASHGGGLSHGGVAVVTHAEWVR